MYSFFLIRLFYFPFPHFLSLDLFPLPSCSGSFGGALLWENQEYISPNTARSLIKRKANSDYQQRLDAKKHREEVLEENPLQEDELEDVFE